MLEPATGYDPNDSKYGYAGILGKHIYAIKINNHRFRVHTLGKGWGSEIKAGGIGGDYVNPIDGIAISGAEYRAYDDHWLPAVTGYNINDNSNGYAGNLGTPITAFMVRGSQYSAAIFQ